MNFYFDNNINILSISLFIYLFWIIWFNNDNIRNYGIGQVMWMMII